MHDGDVGRLRHLGPSLVERAALAARKHARMSTDMAAAPEAPPQAAVSPIGTPHRGSARPPPAALRAAGR